jgi:hypothetical protein
MPMLARAIFFVDATDSIHVSILTAGWTLTRSLASISLSLSLSLSLHVCICVCLALSLSLSLPFPLSLLKVAHTVLANGGDPPGGSLGRLSCCCVGKPATHASEEPSRPSSTCILFGTAAKSILLQR